MALDVHKLASMVRNESKTMEGVDKERTVIRKVVYDITVVLESRQRSSNPTIVGNANCMLVRYASS